VAITPDGRTVVSCSADGTARVWDLDSGETRYILNAHNVAPKTVAIGPDGAIAALGYEDYAVRLWDLNGELRSILSGHRGDALCVAFSKSGARLVSGSHDAKVLVWDPQQDEPLRVIDGRPGDVLCVALNAEGTRALIGAENGLRLWDPILGEEIAELAGHSAPVTGAAFGPDGVAASCSMDGSNRLWDINRRRAYQVLTHHKGPVIAVVFTPDGRVLLSASEDGTLSAWSVRTGLCLNSYGKEVRQAFELPAVSKSGATMQLAFKVGDIPRSIAMSPDGQHVIVGSSRGAVLRPLFHADTPLDSPKVYTDDDPYRDFMPLYASLGLRVARDGANAGKLELYV
jgi:WD40 repeat protein